MWLNLILATLAVVFIGRWWVIRRKYRCLRNAHKARLDDFCERHQLTDREKEILCLILDGKSNTEIGRKIFISTHTVRNHVHSIFQKLAVKNRVELVNLVRDALPQDISR
jgi:DNA-binding CsgD family transcriptional regulator